MPEDFEPSGLAEQVLAQALSDVFGDNPPAGLRTRVAEGHPGEVLVGASQDAGLLVVGSRGHGGLVSTLLGSVSTYCAHHAHCPVVVIRPPAPAAPGTAAGGASPGAN